MKKLRGFPCGGLNRHGRKNMSVSKESIAFVLDKLAWMRERKIWPNGLRYLWTDAFGVVLLVSLYRELEDGRYLGEAEWLVGEVERVLGRPRGIRIGEAADRDGQYFHYLAMWLFALHVLGKVRPEYKTRAIELVRQIHPRFVRPGVGVFWKMREDLSAPYPGFGLGALDPFHGYVVYRLIDSETLAEEIVQMRELIEDGYRTLYIHQDLGLGMMLWVTHFFPDEGWAELQHLRSLDTLDTMWIDPPGYFCRHRETPGIRYAFTNYGVSVGLQAVRTYPERVSRLNDYFAFGHPGDEYDLDAITHVMACNSRFPGELLKG